MLICGCHCFAASLALALALALVLRCLCKAPTLALAVGRRAHTDDGTRHPCSRCMQGRWAPLAASLTSASQPLAWPVLHTPNAPVRSTTRPPAVLFRDKFTTVRYQPWPLPSVTPGPVGARAANTHGNTQSAHAPALLAA
ncbi:uncharacterized protein SETTUDRAFT_38603 [Exserohilum turcica Et28A]|uniref:Secreted protein n=1 Tax=Exserohilum turcicum (strain 28A) TaxID=671987 RepID=R0KKS6_EXST2|nr:uncharacterized protein SETTUDRAFT_38603 [Exserohilum turcica Et28A]EOA88562.1 hypothetical protein SETTUDRAFT_38603 [Exserohilum turcica Et28A]